MKKLLLMSVLFILSLQGQEDTLASLHNHLNRLEKKIDDLSKKECKCTCNCEEMMKKMKPMHEKMMAGMKGQEEKPEKMAQEEHEKHHPKK
ncbi:hypothetical protein M1446_03995 [Candidatus Dependentiae bacterium]|nr:hypothetical protein [Candidatus Dependentiae bacterium]